MSCHTSDRGPKSSASRWVRLRVRSIFIAASFVLAIAGLGVCAAAEGGQAVAQKQPAKAAHPSNAELANPQIEARVEKLLRQMTLEEKIGQLVQYNDTGDAVAAAAASVGADNSKPSALAAINPETTRPVNAMQLAATGGLGSMLNTIGKDRTNTYQHLAVEKSRLHIPLLFGADVIHGYRTIYPVPLGLAASFDPKLVAEVSRMSAEEARTAGVRWFYSPMVDISRDARWGRSTEGAGEDPYLGAAMARAYIRGYQGESLGKPGSVAASVKHFAAYGAAEAGREYNTTDMPDLSSAVSGRGGGGSRDDHERLQCSQWRACQRESLSVEQDFAWRVGLQRIRGQRLHRSYGVDQPWHCTRRSNRHAQGPEGRRRCGHDVALLRHRVAGTCSLWPGAFGGG
jgi:hypothetical protein